MRHVLITGLTAAGKTTQALHLARELDLAYVSGSQIRSRLLGLSEHVATDTHFWRTDTRAQLLDRARIVEVTPADKVVDDELIYIAKQNRPCVFDVWVMPWLYRDDALCVYLRSSPETRIRRLLRSSPTQGLADVARTLTEKDSMAHRFFIAAYQADILYYMAPFDIVVDSNEHDGEAGQCLSYVSEYLTAVVQIALSGDIAMFEDFLHSTKRWLDRPVKVWISTNLISRISDRQARFAF